MYAKHRAVDWSQRAPMSQGTTKGVSGTVLVCVVLTSGALFGVAALVLLRYLGLDPSSVRSDLAIGAAAAHRLTLAWWAWWLAAALAFFVGRLGTALARLLAANRGLFRGLLLSSTAAIALALAAMGHLLPARSDAGGTSDAATGLGIVALATALAALGARSGRERRPTSPPAIRPGSWRSDGWSPVGSLPPVLHDGSVNAGLPSLGMRPRQPLAATARISLRGAVAAMATAIAVAGVSALGSTSVVQQQSSLHALRAPVKSKQAAAGSIRSSRPARASATVGVSPDTADPPPPPPVQQPAAVAGAFAMATPDEKELTFARGYARRRAALEAAGIMPAKPQVKLVPVVRRAPAAAPSANRHDRPAPVRSDDFQRSFGGG